MEHPHIFLHDGGFIPIEFTPNPRGGKPASIPSRDALAHEASIRTQYDRSIASAIQKLAERRDANLPVADGVYLDVELKGKNPPINSLDGKKGARLRNVNCSADDATTIASVFLPAKKSNWLTNKLDKYQQTAATGGKIANKKLINSIETVQNATIRSLFPDKNEYDELQPNHETCFELWLDEVDEAKIDDTITVLNQLGISLAYHRHLVFEHVTVLLVNATKEAIDDIPYSLDNVEAVRRYYNPAELVDENEKNREWADLILDDVVANVDNNSVRVAVLDYGVNNGHPLLEHFLPDDKRATVLPDTNVFHEYEHGTGMAGLVEYGDMTEFMCRRGHLEINHVLASVKMMSQTENDPLLYGQITSDAIEEAETLGANISCMAVSENHERNDGFPTSWSAAIDNALFNNGQCNRVMVLSAGNIETQNIDSENYLTSVVNASIQSPGQSQNAIVVGAYTRKSIVQNDDFTTIAPPDGLSPLTRSSLLWRRKTIKPDIVMEGGNVARHRNILYGNNTLSELNLVTTCPDFNQTPLMGFNATSAATALAARLAARVKSANPELSALSIRALMIHSANWTEEMKHLGDKPSDIMRYCGYGVPDERKAMASDDTHATFIVENELTPFDENGKYKEMHFYALPWPKDVLEQIDAETVRMRVTLSYYIEPSPTCKSALKNYRAASAGLSFDVNTPYENREQFIARNNRKQETEEDSDNDSTRWKIKKKWRETSTVQSDWFECTARELAACNEIAVFPSGGWWKYRKIANVHNRIKYSLVVSIETSETEIYNAVRIAVDQTVPVEVGR